MAHRASISSWLIRLIAWDGVLPVAILSAPFLVRWLIPDNRSAIELTAVVLPLVAFFVRYQVGRRHIASNDCGPVVRRVQVVVLCLGIFVLVLIDAVMVLCHVMPKGAAFTTTTDLIVWMVLYAIYLAAMALAMYPGSPWHSDPVDPLVADSGVNQYDELDREW
jgi:hypothetical protein